MVSRVVTLLSIQAAENDRRYVLALFVENKQNFDSDFCVSIKYWRETSICTHLLHIYIY